MLTDTKARAAKASRKPYKLTDRDGLYLFITPSGAKSWRYDYRYARKRYTLTLGRYPEAGLSTARNRLAESRRLVEHGENPAAVKQREKTEKTIANANTVRAMGEKWYADRKIARSDSWRQNAKRWLEKDIYPAFGEKPLKDVAVSDVERLIGTVKDRRGAKSAECVRLTVAGIFKAAPRSLGLGNPARDLAGTIDLPKPKPKGRPLSAKEIPPFMEAADRYPGRPQTKLAIRLLMLTFARKRELIEAPWTEIDLDGAEWVISPGRMKADKPHVVPLSRQAVECFRKLKELSSGSPYVFPNLGNPKKPMGASTLNNFFEQIGYGGERFTPHGARSTASTALNSQGWSADAIERQLAHSERDLVRAAYNHSDHMQERRKMMQSWADYLDGLCSGANVTSIRRSA
jgi:integrase